jgi:hypothetical protein
MKKLFFWSLFGVRKGKLTSLKLKFQRKKAGIIFKSVFFVKQNLK